MGRKAKPYQWRDWFVTEAGGHGIHKLCPLEDGIDKAEMELSKWLQECSQKKTEGLLQTDSPYTVAEIAAEFVQHKKTTKSEASFKFHHNYTKRLVKWYGHVELTKLNLIDGSNYVGRLQKEGLSSTTIAHHVNSAKMVLGFAVDNDLLAKNPWKKLPKLDENRRERIVTDEEFQKLLLACKRLNKEHNRQTMRDALRILRFTALRPGELRILRWEYIHWDLSFIIIPAKLTKTGRTAKKPKDRKVPILDEAVAILRSRQERYGHQPLVFPDSKGREWYDVDFSHRFARLRKRAGLDAPDKNGEQLVWYSLRHTRLTEAATKEGWAIHNLMKFAGHTNSRTTDRYIHPDEEDLLREARQGQAKRQDKAV